MNVFLLIYITILYIVNCYYIGTGSGNTDISTTDSPVKQISLSMNFNEQTNTLNFNFTGHETRWFAMAFTTNLELPWTFECQLNANCMKGYVIAIYGNQLIKEYSLDDKGTNDNRGNQYITCSQWIVNNGFRTGVCQRVFKSVSDTFINLQFNGINNQEMVVLWAEGISNNEPVGTNNKHSKKGTTKLIINYSSNNPTINPTKIPTNNPTQTPTTSNPTIIPTLNPTSINPTNNPSKIPTKIPTQIPTTKNPTKIPTINPTTNNPTVLPTKIPTNIPTLIPTTLNPTNIPTMIPTQIPTTNNPTINPTINPTNIPSLIPTLFTLNPTNIPSITPTLLTKQPSQAPTVTRNPSNIPTLNTNIPTNYPTNTPTKYPTNIPSVLPTKIPTNIPTNIPTLIPTTLNPTIIPTLIPTNIPSVIPTKIPTKYPTDIPTEYPTKIPSVIPTKMPSMEPTLIPSKIPSMIPTTNIPTVYPTNYPSVIPTKYPTNIPSVVPTLITDNPSVIPTNIPSVLTTIPTMSPTRENCDNSWKYPKICEYKIYMLYDITRYNGVIFNIYFSINYDMINNIFNIELITPNDNTWVSIGITDESQNMIPVNGYTKAIVYEYVNTNWQLNEYILNGKNMSNITKSNDQSDIQLYQTFIYNNLRVIQFTHKLSDIFVTPFISQNWYFIFAVGISNTFEFHGFQQMNSRKIPWNYGNISIPTQAPTILDKNTECIKIFNITKIQDTPISIGIIFNCTSNIMYITIIGPINKWFGIGFGKHMIGSDSIVYTTGLNNDKPLNVYNYYIGGRNIIDFEYLGILNTTNITTDNDMVIIHGYRYLNIKNGKNKDFNIFDKSIDLICAWGENGYKLEQHSREAFKQNINIIFGVNSINIKEIFLDNMVVMHGTLMAGCWGFFVIISVFISRYRMIVKCKCLSKAIYVDNQLINFDDDDASYQPKWWFYIHRGINIFAIIWCCLGFTTISLLTESRQVPHFRTTHSKIGITLVILAIIQPIVAIFRPKDHNENEKKILQRRIWEWIHKIQGFGMLFASQFVIILGLQLIGFNNLISKYIIYISILFCIAIILEIGTAKYRCILCLRSYNLCNFVEKENERALKKQTELASMRNNRLASVSTQSTIGTASLK